MPKFIVNVREVHVQMVEIEATSAEDARQKVSDGAGLYLDGKLEYSHTLEPGTWTVDQTEAEVMHQFANPEVK